MLNKFIEKIRNNDIINVSFFAYCDVDELLDMRDDEEFDSEWMRVYNILNEINIEDSEKQIIDRIREKSFIRIYNLSESSDIASCVSDDFEIICKACISGYDDKWLNSLIMSYAKNEFPCGKLEITEYNLTDSINYLLN
ncbi:MAG: hypothetical protein HDT39_06225 [Lachnospiraceae bacterium]|nr:hypothetical protein [Lachnospiraceae bacterium]